LSRVQIHSHPFTLVGYRFPYERMYLVPDCPSSAPHVLLYSRLRATLRVKHCSIELNIQMSKHERLSTRSSAQDAQHKMSSQVSARKLLLLHWRQHQGSPPSEQIEDTQVPRLKALMETTANGFQVGGYGPKGNEKFWLTKNSSAVCSDKMEAAQPL